MTAYEFVVICRTAYMLHAGTSFLWCQIMKKKCSWPDKNEVYVSMIVRKTVFVYQTFLKIFLKFWQDK